MKNINSKSLAIFLFCITYLTAHGGREPGFGDDLNKAATAGLFSTVNDINKVSSSGDGTAISSSKLIIDTKNDTLKAEGGVKFKYQGLKLQAFGFERDKTSNVVTADGEVRIEMGDGNNRARIDSRKTLLAMDNSTLKYYDSISYMQVGTVTGAEAPNDRIYFGGEVGEYNEEAFTLKNTWFTTDYSILESGNYREAGYYLKSKKLKIIADNKAEFQDVDLYINNHRVAWFPWYAINIRQGSQVPLFPEWGTKTDYGFYITTGMNYGDKDSKYFKGGIAPKFADEMGWLIDRYENWHDLGKYGEGLITVDDLLVIKKEDDFDNR
jgi:lipopolysaccharide assembly outer membrane protein LptD (OstA)